jgi:RNA polymerase sigma factor (sigma-70 family)
MSEADRHSVTMWIGQLQAGDAAASQKLWERYVERLMALARRKLSAGARRAADEQDVVQEAFQAFFRAARAGKFPLLNDRDDLWQLLVKITDNKLRDQTKQARRQKRGAGNVRGESVFHAPGEDAARPAGLDQIPAAAPTPDFAAATIENCRRLLSLLGTPDLMQLALLKLQGHSHEEIAARLNCSTDTIARKLRLVRAKWKGFA